MGPHRNLDELELTPAQRTLLERVVAQSTIVAVDQESGRIFHILELTGADLGTGRRLAHLGLVVARGPRRIVGLDVGADWLKAHPRRGRPWAKRGGLAERVDVRIDKATAETLDSEAARKGCSRGEVAREVLKMYAAAVVKAAEMAAKRRLKQ